jgi:hypothetical protein
MQPVLFNDKTKLKDRRLYHLLEHAVIKSCLFSERENLKALRRVYKLVKEIQVPVQTVLQYTFRGGVQAPYCLIDKIDVDCAEVIEITPN